MSFKVGVKTAGDKNWVYNAIRLGTKEEAEAYAFDLMMRWLGVIDYEVQKSDDPVNYSFKGGKLYAVEKKIDSGE